MMTPDDHARLNAYLDDELNLAGRKAVEADLAVNSELAEYLRSLTTLRSLIATLPRAQAPDISGLVMEHLRAQRIRRSARRGLSRRVAALAAAAAAIGLLALLPIVFKKQPRPTPAWPPADNPSLNASASTPPPTILEATASPQPSNGLNKLDIANHFEMPVGDRVFAEFNDGDSHLEKFRAFLDDPRLRRVFMITDQIGEPAEGQVESLIAHSTRQDYYKLTVAQGIVIDPSHPGEATVFAFVIDENQVGALRDRFKHQFQERFHDADVAPGMVTQLAEVGQVIALPGSPAADVTIPEHALAIRSETIEKSQEAGGLDAVGADFTPSPAPMVANVPKGSNLGVPSPKAREGNRNTPPQPAVLAGQKEDRTGPVAQANHREPAQAVVLVWLSRPGHG